MEVQEILALGGLAVAVLGAIGGIVVRDRYIQRQISQGDKSVLVETRADSDRIREDVKEVHARINRVRDEYVKHADLDNHIKRLDNNIVKLGDELRTSSERTNQRLDAVLAHLMGKVEK